MGNTLDHSRPQSKVEGEAEPSSCTRAFAAAINSCDLEAASRCFSKEACFLTPDSTAVRGREEIRPILHQLIVARSNIEIQGSSFVTAGEVALGSEQWLLSSAGLEGEPFSRTLNPTLVLRRIEGAWKLAVAMPWGHRS